MNMKSYPFDSYSVLVLAFYKILKSFVLPFNFKIVTLDLDNNPIYQYQNIEVNSEYCSEMELK